MWSCDKLILNKVVEDLICIYNENTNIIQAPLMLMAHYKLTNIIIIIIIIQKWWKLFKHH